MAGEIRPIFSKEAEEQLKVINTQIANIYDSVKTLDKVKLDFKTFKDYQKAVKEQADETTKLTAEQKKLQKATENLAFAQSEEGKELIRIREQTKNVNKENREAAKDAQTASTGYDRLRLSLNKAEKEYRDLAAIQGLASNETKQAQKRVQELRAEVDAINEPIKRFSDNVGNYASAVPGFDKLNAVLSGIGVNLGDIAENGTGARKTFAEIQGGIVKATQAALRFIATPIGATIAAFAAIGIATQQFFRFNSEIGKTNVLVERLANTTGEATDELRQQATAIERAYGKDFQEAVKELSDLQKDFGVTSEEAFDIYNEGLARGGAASAEFGDSIREYGSLFADAGFTAEEFLNILNTGIDLGIYNDKLPDAIKEAGLSLKEQTTATRDALVNAFGASFTDKILNDVSSGEKTVKEALFAISNEARTAQLNQQQLAQLTADVFRGAGEDAGGAAKIFEALNKSVNLSREALSDYSKAVKTSSDLFNELEKAKTKAFKSDDAIAFTQSIKNFGIEAQTAFFNTIAAVRNFFLEFQLTTDKIAAANRVTYAFIPQLAKAAFDDVISIAKEAANAVIESGSAIKSALTGNISGARNQVNAIKNINFEFTNTQDVLEKIERARDNAAQKVIENYENEKKLLIEQAKLEEALNKKTDDEITNPSGNKFDVSDLIREAAFKNEKALLEAQKRLSEQYRNGQIGAEDFIEKLADLQKEYNSKLIQDTIEALERTLITERLTAEEKKEVIEELANFRIEAQKISIQAVEDAAKRELEIQKELAEDIKKEAEDLAEWQKKNREKSSEEEIENTKKTEEEIQAIKQGIAQVGYEALTTFANEFFAAQSARQQEELNGFIENQNKRINYVNDLEQQGVISAEEAARRRLRIEEETARKQAEFARKQAIADKANALFNIAINTAQGITAALASVPPNPILAGIVGATGAIQAAAVAARPIPEFFKGTDSSPEGLAYVGERGTELLEYPDGSKKLATQETLTWLPKGTRVHTAEKTKEILGDSLMIGEIKGLRKDLRRKRMGVNINVSNDSKIDYLRG